MKNNSFSVVLVAAGASKRLGHPKQLVKLNGQTLLRRQSELALELSTDVVVVLGSEAGSMLSEVKDLPVTVVINQLWSNGMASSISAGVQQLSRNSRACLILLVDQWLLSSRTLKPLVSAWQQCPDEIWQCTNASKTAKGPPVIFPANFYSDLSNIDGEQGAKSVIQANLSMVNSVQLEAAFTDLDTPEQLMFCLSKIAAINPK